MLLMCHKMREILFRSDVESVMLPPTTWKYNVNQPDETSCILKNGYDGSSQLIQAQYVFTINSAAGYNIIWHHILYMYFMILTIHYTHIGF